MVAIYSTSCKTKPNQKEYNKNEKNNSIIIFIMLLYIFSSSNKSGRSTDKWHRGNYA